MFIKIKVTLTKENYYKIIYETTSNGETEYRADFTVCECGCIHPKFNKLEGADNDYLIKIETTSRVTFT